MKSKYASNVSCYFRSSIIHLVPNERFEYVIYEKAFIQQRLECLKAFRDKMSDYRIFISTYCRGDPGICGFGMVIESAKGLVEDSEAYRLTIVDRVELLAVIKAFTSIREQSKVQIYTQSALALENWMEFSIAKPVERVFLCSCEDIQPFFASLFSMHQISITLLGYDGSAQNLFTRCDDLAQKAVRRSVLASDKWFEDRYFQNKATIKRPNSHLESQPDKEYLISGNSVDLMDVLEASEGDFDFRKESDLYTYSTFDLDEWIASEFDAYWDAEAFQDELNNREDDYDYEQWDNSEF